MTSPADRGKQAEKEVKKILTKLSLRSDTAFIRLPDARAGSYQTALCDFQLLYQGTLYLLEVKETKHNYRLPHGNYSHDQVARMRRWQLAGAEAHVLIYHTELNKWRTAPVDYFLDRTGGSWDLRDLDLMELDQILKEGKFNETQTQTANKTPP
jgi:penicillin-binding protein-related factor A (putative recombinase)